MKGRMEGVMMEGRRDGRKKGKKGREGSEGAKG